MFGHPRAWARLCASLLVATGLVLVGVPPSHAAAPTLSVSDASVIEGDSGYRWLAFTVRLANPTGRHVTVGYTTSNGTAKTPSDYGAARGEVSFSGSQTAKKVYVPVYGDTQYEPKETLKLTLANPKNAVLGDKVAVGSIRNNDPGPKALTIEMVGDDGFGIAGDQALDFVCLETCSKAFPHGTQVTLEAASMEPSQRVFAGWSGAGCSGTGQCLVTLAANTTVTATYIPAYSLTVVKSGSGSGSVHSDPDPDPTIPVISCGDLCSAAYPQGQIVTLHAAPDVGSAFVGWSGPCTGTGDCTVTMSQAREVTATFVALHALTVTKAGNGSGTVVSDPAGINCGLDCTETFVQDTMVTLTASPEGDSVFTGWSGDCSGSNSVCVVSMSEARNVVATFSLV